MKRKTFIKTLILTSGAIMIGNKKLFAKNNNEDSITLKMIYNNFSSNSELKNEWGLSIWIEYKNDVVLFDTGGNPLALWENIEKLNLDTEKISTTIISHLHWDHINGLPLILEKTNNKPIIYVPDFDLQKIKETASNGNFIGITEPQKINDFIWSTGQMDASYKNISFYEQSIIIEKNNSIYIFTGCSHPGIVEIVEKVISIFPNKIIQIVAGGFHLLQHSDEQVKNISDKLKELKIQKIAPSHCTGEKAIELFKNEWKEYFVDFNLGDNFII
ncbi:MAG: MBL fold metallo-hydrolase [Ignavibacteriales bacterium]|nr:MBL fold metallo-hydrolase [Ignavibacteriales bacterium]